jgi:large subunit ribosomal protein L21
MYAIINDSDRQTTVREGDVILCDLKADAQPGASITFDQVLLVGNEGSVRVGKPTVDGASVTGEVLGEAKGEKLVAFRFKRRKNVRVKRGHRQRYTRVRIASINA